jgi:hypothetical protein
MTKHRIKLQFNDPPEAYYGEMIYHLLGPYTEQMIGQTAKFKKELGSAVSAQNLDKDIPPAEIFLELTIAMRPGGKKRY